MGMETVDTEALDKADMERLAQGHDAGLNALMERHAGPLFQFLLRMLGDEQDANDLSQERFVRVYRQRERFDGSKFTTWLYTIASNLARNEYRRRARHPVVSLHAENPGAEGRLEDTLAAADSGTRTAAELQAQQPEDPGAEGRLADPLPAAGSGPRTAAELQEQQEAVRAAVQQLPDDLREALILCEWQEMSAAEAATILQTTSRAIESRLYRARRLLRDQLKRWL